MWEGDGADGGVVWVYAVMGWREWKLRERAEGVDVEEVRFIAWRCMWVCIGFRIGNAIELLLKAIYRLAPWNHRRLCFHDSDRRLAIMSSQGAKLLLKAHPRMART